VAHVLPIDGTLDLHAFGPREAARVVEAYLEACAARGVLDVRVIHGKGIGAMRRTVEAVLRRHALVESFRLADEAGGGRGATLVRLRASRDSKA
jgi:DNA-nicking Smr family endonuclease